MQHEVQALAITTKVRLRVAAWDTLYTALTPHSPRTESYKFDSSELPYDVIQMLLQVRRNL